MKTLKVMIDSAWLSVRGGGPWVLDGAGTTYMLAADVKAKGTAFVVTAADVTLDLGGHTVTFGDGPATSVTNGGFEEGDGRTVPGWDLSGAPSAALAANTSYLFGDRVLRLSNFSTLQSIISGPVAVPEAGRAIAATITPANGHWDTVLKLSVVDDVTGDVLASSVSRSVDRGISAVASFVPKTTHPVLLRVDVVPPPGRADTLDLDLATLDCAYDCGVIATRAPSDEVPGLPPSVQATYKGAAGFTVKNGSIVQGAGRGHAATALFCKAIPGLAVDEVTIELSGVDSVGINADNATVAVFVRDNIITQNAPNITDRLQDFAAISLNKVAGTIDVRGNRLLGSPQIGIMVTDNDPAYRATIKDNEVRHHAIVTNGYGLVIAGLSNFEVSGNTIDTTNGRGIDIDGYSPKPTARGTVHDNHVSVREGPNREERDDGSARALRMRNNVDAMGAHRDLRVYHNTFLAATGPGLMRTAFGGRIDYVNNRGQMNEAGVVIEHNLFKAVVTTEDDSYHAQALDVDGVDPGIHLQISGNTLESNDVSLAIGGGDQGPVYDVTFTANTVRKSAGGSDRPYTGVKVGYWVYEVHGVSLIDTRAEGGATTDIVWSGSGAKDVTVTTTTVYRQAGSDPSVITSGPGGKP